MSWNAETFLEQTALESLGFSPGVIDGIDGPKTKKAKSSWLAFLVCGFCSTGCGLNIHLKDGIDGQKTKKAKSSWLASRFSDNKPTSPPKSDYQSMVDYYGQPGDESALVEITFPYPMRLAWDTSVKVTRTRCHALIVKPLLAALQEILDVHGILWVQDHKLDLYGGCYNNRNTRGGQSKSKHAWGAAIDLNPTENGNHTPWQVDKIGVRGFATMPVEAIEIFEKHGFKSGGRSWTRDAMHFQFTQ
tara:strand:+ start:588 stop:1325 length:738 start_codon:yes stop_codon:yes gene_type:complete